VQSPCSAGYTLFTALLGDKFLHPTTFAIAVMALVAAPLIIAGLNYYGLW
jgi:hypothetical protein